MSSQETSKKPHERCGANGASTGSNPELVDEGFGDRINPFVHDVRINGVFDWVKVYVFTVVLLPIRVMGSLLFVIIAWIFACITLHGLTLEDLRHKPLCGWRRTIRKGVEFSMRVVFAFVSFYYVKFKGIKATSKKAPVLVVAPHSSYMDSIVVSVAGPPSIVAKQETAYIPFLGKIINCAQPIYVLRKDADSRQNTIRQIVSRARSDENWPQVAIFPEGTCTNRSALIKFKPGAFYPGVPVQPVLIKYPNKYDTFTWTWIGPGILKLVWLTLTNLYSRCELEFLPVYTPNEAERSDAKLYADNVRAVMARALGVPISDYTFEDCIFMNRAKDLQIPHPDQILDFDRAIRALGPTEARVDDKLGFADVLCHSQIDLDKFAEVLQVCVNPAVKKLFTILQHANSNRIDIRDYLLCTYYCRITDEPLIDFLRTITRFTTPSENCIPPEDFYQIVRHSGKISMKESDKLFHSIDNHRKGEISFEDFEKYTSENHKYAYLYKKQELIRRI